MKDLRERLSQYQEAPSDELWGRIAAQQKERGYLWPVMIEALSLVGMGVLVYSLVSFEVKSEELTVKSEKAKVEPAVVIVEDVATEEKIEGKKTVEIVFKEKEKEEEIIEVIDETPSSIPESPAIIIKPEEEKTPEKETVPPYKKPKSKFQFYFSVTPSLSFQKMIPSGNDAIIIQGFEHRSPLSIKRFGFGIDAGFERDINRYFGFYGGLSFYRQHQELTYTYYDKDAQVTRVGDAWVFEIDRQQHNKTFDYSMTNFGVSSGLLVTLKGEKLKHKFGAGLTYSMSNKSQYLSYQLFYRNELKINDHFSWYIEPTFIYSFISKERLSEPFVLKPYRAGITTGVLYRF